MSKAGKENVTGNPTACFLLRYSKEGFGLPDVVELVRLARAPLRNGLRVMRPS